MKVINSLLSVPIRFCCQLSCFFLVLILSGSGIAGERLWTCLCSLHTQYKQKQARALQQAFPWGSPASPVRGLIRRDGRTSLWRASQRWEGRTAAPHLLSQFRGESLQRPSVPNPVKQPRTQSQGPQSLWQHSLRWLCKPVIHIRSLSCTFWRLLSCPQFRGLKAWV